MDSVPTPKFRLALLGNFELIGRDGYIDLTSKKLVGLLAFLACTAPQPQRREKLMALLWGSHSEAQARLNLRQALTRLRRVLGPSAIIRNGETVSLDPGEITCDVVRFETLVRHGSRNALAEAVEFYKDQLLAGIAIPEETWTEWLDVQRQRLESLALDAMIKLGECELRSNAEQSALRAANRAIAVNSLREDAHRLAIRALAASGRRADALKHYERLAALLKRELGVEPDAATLALAVELRGQQSTVHSAEPNSGISARPHETTLPLPDPSSTPSKRHETSPKPQRDTSTDRVPEDVAEKVDSDVIADERKHVTVMCADLKEPLELIADRDPEQALKIFDAVLKLMRQAVHRYGGTVNLVTCDGIMALFGVPLAHEDHAVRACYAALELQEEVRRYAEGSQPLAEVPILVRAGLNSGEAVVHSIASGPHTEYWAMGQTVHLAARLGQMAAPGTLVVSGETLRLAEGHVQVKALKPANISCRGGPVYELVAAGPAQTRFQIRAARGLTRLVGRDLELEQLRRAQQLAANGHGQVVAVVGEAGVGKSRLVYEFIHSHRMQGWLVLEGASVSYGKTTSYLPVINLLKGYFKIQDRDDLHEIREKVAGKLLTLDESLKPSLPALLALLDVPVDDASWEMLDPAARRQRTLEAVRRLLLREARKQPLLLMFEDLHWIDGESQAALDTLVDSFGSARLLLLVNHRPEYQHAWGSKTYYSQMRLDPLPAENAGELLEELLGSDPVLVPLKQLLVKRGNPFFLEETIRILVETQALAGEQGRYRLAQPVQAIQIPPTVQAMLAARIDRLSAKDKRLLQVASVIGKDVPFALLQAIVELPNEALRCGLDRLQAVEFLYGTGLFSDLGYSFRHALIHEVTYGGLLQDRRRELDARIVAAIETLHRDRLGEHTERLAHHALRGELREKAVHYLRQAGLKAAARSALHDARVWFEQALSVVDALPESGSILEQAFEIRLELRPVLVQLGDLRRARERLREAEALAERLNDDRRRGRVWASMTYIYAQLGELDEALTSGIRARAIAQTLGDLELRGSSAHYLANAQYLQGEYARVVELATDNLAAGASSRWAESVHGCLARAAPPSAYDRCWLVLSLAQLGRFAEAAEHEAEAIRLAELTHRVFAISLAHYASGTLHLCNGDWAGAHSLIERWIAAARTGNILLHLPWAVSSSAWVMAQLGEAREAEKRLRESEELLEQHGARGIFGFRGWAYHALGRACLLLGRLDEARRLGDRAIESSQRYPGFAAHALHLLGDIATHPDQFDAECGETYYRRALVLAEPRGMRPLIAHCHLGLGELYRRTGERRKAEEHLATATTMYGDMDMRFWLEKAEAEIEVSQ